MTETVRDWVVKRIIALEEDIEVLEDHLITEKEDGEIVLEHNPYAAMAVRLHRRAIHELWRVRDRLDKEE